VGALITIDPVSHGRPDMGKVRENSGNWINVNANPDPAKRAEERNDGNLVAGVGGAWNSAPKGYAHQHYNANINHTDTVDEPQTTH
jgi:hypothetical protein